MSLAEPTSLAYRRIYGASSRPLACKCLHTLYLGESLRHTIFSAFFYLPSNYKESKDLALTYSSWIVT